MRFTRPLLTFVLAALPVIAHAASLTGDTIRVDNVYPTVTNTSTIETVTVPNGPTLYAAGFYISVLPNQIVLQELGSGVNFGVSSYDGLSFTDLTALGFSDGVSFNALLSTVNPVGYSSTGNQFEVNLSGLHFSTGDKITFDIGTPVSPTPEPSSLVFLGTGIVGAFGVVRRRFTA